MGKIVKVGALRLHRQNGHILCQRGGKFHVHNVVGGLQHVWRHGKEKQLAVDHRLVDGMVEILAGKQKFVVPNGNGAEVLSVMDLFQERLG